MPSVSGKQHRLMEMVAHDPGAAKRTGIPKSVGEEFAKADEGRKFAVGGSLNPEKAIRAANMIARRVGRADGGDLDAYHGSPKTDLTSISATPPARQFDNATSQWGAYFAPNHQEAERYAGKTGKIYKTKYAAKNPYRMPASEWSYYQDITRGPRDADGFRGKQLPSEKWGDRQQELIKEAIARRKELEAAGHDGVILMGPKGDVKEMSSFNDVPLKARGGRAAKAPGGSLSDAMNSFSKEREDSLKRPASGSTASDAALLAMLRPHPQLAIAEPEDSRRRMAPSGQVADLGAQIDEGAHWLAGQSDDEPPVVSGVHQTAVKQGSGPTLLTTKSFSNAPDANGAYRPAYSLSDADLSPAVINTIAGEANTNNPAGVDAVINNMFNRLGTTDYGPAGNLAQVARSQGVNGKTPQYTGYRQAHPDEADYIRSRIQAIASGGVPDNTNGSMEYRGAWLYNKAAQMHPEGVGVGGNWFFPTNAQPGPYAAGRQSENAQTDAAPQRQVDAQGIAKVPNRDGSFTLTDQNGQTVGYDRGSAPLASVPQSQPHMQPAQVPAQTAPQPQPQQQPQQQPPSDQLGQADPMSNMFDRMAMMPEVASGYDSPQVLYQQPDQAKRGGYIRRAAGGPTYASMPTNELIARALEIIRKHRDTGGSTSNGLPNNGALRVSGLTEHAPNGDILLNQDLPNPSPSRSNNTAMWEPPIEIPSSSPAPAAAQTPVANNPAVAAGTVGNAAGATGSPIGTIPMAAPTQPPPPDWNNTLDQALQTNNPTMNQIFGFNYPQNLPSPKPQPQGPVSQDEINALYGFGGGSQMGTGTFQSGGAIIMDALNRARRAKGAGRA